MIDNTKGGYRFLKGGGPFSSGCRAMPGHEVVHATCHSLPPLERGFDLIEKHLQSLDRPIQALCGMELRIPEALSGETFNQFNEPYVRKLKDWNLLVDDLNPVARTNVALEPYRVAQGSIHGFSYTIESGHSAPTLVIAGAGELISSKSGAAEIVRRGDTSLEGLTEKAETVLEIMTKRLTGLETDWSVVTTSVVYCVYDIHPLLKSTILPRLGKAASRGLQWFYSRPPVIDIDFEMDVRAVRQEIVLS